MTESSWLNEPNELAWTDESTGLACRIFRHDTMGHLCGYVGVPHSHPLYRWSYDFLPVNIDVHGGLTFAGKFSPDDVESPGLWWFGFDCAHGGDLVPRGVTFLRGVYRDMNFVGEECKKLAMQIARASNLNVDEQIQP